VLATSPIRSLRLPSIDAVSHGSYGRYWMAERTCAQVEPPSSPTNETAHGKMQERSLSVVLCLTIAVSDGVVPLPGTKLHMVALATDAPAQEDDA
jgi:hypothetical protein